ncbi:hypothetical protein ACH5RR_021596 [Cinchona calisaya]|uniref:Uncharacterized protein n=1 Tax=Cinchona calisaya TaxID=153742 RepID=A0ABD2ZKP4_9GENT
MASRNIQVSSKVVGKSSSTVRRDDISSVSPWTHSKSKEVVTMTDHIGDDWTRTQTVITFGVRKHESSESKKLASILEDSMSNEVSHDKSLNVSDADSNTGSPSKSLMKEQRQLDSALFEVSYTSSL